MIGTASPARPLSILDRIVAWRDALREDLRRRDHYQRTVAELQALTDRDLDDLSIARCDIRRLARESVYGA